MKNHINRTVILSLTLLNFCFCSMVQADIKLVNQAIKINKEKAKLPYYWLVRMHEVKSENRCEYEQKISIILNKLKGHPFYNRVITLYNPSHGFYCYLFPLLDMQEWTAINHNWQKEFSRANLQKLINSFSVILTQSMTFLSELPSTESLSTKNKNFLKVDVIHLVPGSENQFKELVKAWGARIRKEAPGCGWFFHEILIGDNLPAYFLFSGDCIENSELGISFEKFVVEKGAMNSVIKDIKNYDSDFLPQLSTAPFVYQGK